ncbi:hypothetical protein D3C80_1383960 [compost metagenome]
MTKKEGMPNVHSIEALHRPSGGPQASPLFNNQRNNQQTALPLPATGARQPRKAANDREHPVRLTKAKCLNRVNDLASNAPRHPRR